MFDADAWRAGREPWTYTDGGRTWTARPVSALAVADTLTGLEGASHREQAVLWRRLFRLAFPWSWLYAVFPQFDPVRRIMRLEPGAYQAVMVDFLLSLGLGHQATSALPTSGTSSLTPTSPEMAETSVGV